MADVILEAEIREDIGKKVKKVKRAGNIPAVLYGSGNEAKNLTLDYQKFDKAYKEAGESTIIKLRVGKKDVGVLVKDVQYHPVTDKFIHVDFYEVDMTKEITAYVPLDFIGVSKAVKDEGGTLVTSIDEIEIECLPADLPKEIKVDISSLKTFEDAIRIKDLKIPEKVTVLMKSKQVVATVAAPRSEEELEQLEEEVAEDVEKVEGIEKEEEEVEATESEAAAKEEKKDEEVEDQKEEAPKKEEK